MLRCYVNHVGLKNKANGLKCLVLFRDVSQVGVSEP